MRKQSRTAKEENYSYAVLSASTSVPTAPHHKVKVFARAPTNIPHIPTLVTRARLRHWQAHLVLLVNVISVPSKDNSPCYSFRWQQRRPAASDDTWPDSGGRPGEGPVPSVLPPQKNLTHIPARTQSSCTAAKPVCTCLPRMEADLDA